MIFITGDLHGTRDAVKLGSPYLKNLSRRDLLIICGDAGILFDPSETESMINLYSYLPYSVAFVDGNHENFDLLEEYDVEEWNGGYIHRISDNIIHLMRGQIFEIEGKTFFTFGGGLSYDKDRRTSGLDWWPQEIPDEVELKEGLRNLRKMGNKVDFVVTHDCPANLLGTMAKYSRKLQSYGIKGCEVNAMLENIKVQTDFRRWYFGHYHVDVSVDKYRCIYNEIVRI